MSHFSKRYHIPLYETATATATADEALFFEFSTLYTFPTICVSGGSSFT